MNRHLPPGFAALLLLALASLGSASLAAAAEPPPEIVKETNRIVVRDGGEGVQVFSWNGEEGEEPEVLVLGDEGDEHGYAYLTELAGLTRGGYLGIDLVDLTPDLRAHFGAPREAGVMVGMVEADSPAAAAGLHVGDIITAFAGEEAESSWQLGLAIRRHEEGDQAELEVYRDGAPSTLTATLAERQRRMVELPKSFHGRLGHQLPPHTLGPILKRLERIQVDPGDLVPLHTLREKELEQRLEELEKRLEELAEKLDAGGRR